MITQAQIVSSHEIAEAVTDPEVGFFSDLGWAGIGWYNYNDGENGDYCNGRSANVKLGDGNS